MLCSALLGLHDYIVVVMTVWAGRRAAPAAPPAAARCGRRGTSG